MVRDGITRRTTLKTLGGVLALGAAGSAEARTTDRQNQEQVARDYLDNDDLLDNEELEQTLTSLAEENSDLVTVDTIGQSNQGRPLLEVSVGNGDTHVMSIGQQHGDEFIVGAEGLLTVAQYLVGNQEETSEILDNVTVHLVPRVNPDGFVARQRYNIDTDAPARGEGDDIFGGDQGFFTADEEGIGWDINRYHWVDWEESPLFQNAPDEYPRNPVPEARAVIGAVDEHDPDWLVDYHRQGMYTVNEDAEFDPDNPGGAYDRGDYPPSPDDTGAGELTTVSMLWPLNENVPEDARNLSKQVVAMLTNGVSQIEGATPTRYPGGTYGGICRNGYGLDGRGSVLFEVSAGTVGDRAFRIQQVFASMMSALHATADGSLYDVAPSQVDDLPERHVNGFTV